MDMHTVSNARDKATLKSSAVGRLVSHETIPLYIGNAAGAATFAIQPLWIAAFSKSGLLLTSQLGWLATGELFFIAVSGLLVARGQLSSPGRVAMASALLVALANALAMFPSLPALVIGKLLSGLGTGALFAAITGVAAKREDAQRVLALMQVASMVAVSLVYLASPILVEGNRPTGLFGLVAGMCVTAAIAAQVGLRELAARNTGNTHPVGRVNLAAFLGCVALASAGMAVGTINTYVVMIGNSLAFSAVTTARVMAAIGPLAMIGPITAHALGRRTKLLQPVLFAFYSTHLS